MRLSDTIEQFIKAMLSQDEPDIELKRNELAEYFNCAPSQINYVLATRFTPDHGYVIESRRGGGGYIRILRMARDTEQQVQYLLHERIGEAISEVETAQLLSQLKEREIVTEKEARVIRAAVSAQAMNLPIPSVLKDTLRARQLKSMLLETMRKEPPRK